MNKDEIRYALQTKCAAVWNGKQYERVVAWRISTDDYTGAFCSALELAEDRFGVKFIKSAPAAEVEFANLDDRMKAKALAEKLKKVKKKK